MEFPYDLAFSRNIGWITEWEQQALRFKSVAIAGMGGVGGIHLLTLVRFGIGKFHIADFDSFDVVNFNRQVGATVESVGRPKVDTLEEMALSINPSLKIKKFEHGVNDKNLDEFLKGVDIFVDGFDFFVLEIRRKVFAKCAELGIPCLCAAPIGMGVGFLCFKPGGMSFENYFRFEGRSETDQYLRFLVGLVPKALHRSYLVDSSRLNLLQKRGPSTIASCNLCAAVTAVAAVKLLLRRGNVPSAPYHHHYDPYLGRLAITRLRWGNAGLLQRLKLVLGARQIRASARQIPPFEEQSPHTVLEEILNAARWAPSGDNAQPWRFEVLGPESVRIHLTNEHKKNVYEYRNGEPTILAAGALIECLRVAASAKNREITWKYEGESKDSATHKIFVNFTYNQTIQPDFLVAQLTLRSVDRRRYRRRSLTTVEKQVLEQVLGNVVSLSWYETVWDRLRIAALGAMATNIRLRTPETFKVHQNVLDFNNDQSWSGIPVRTLGLNWATIFIMRWAMQSFRRLQMLNQLGGSWSIAAQIDLFTGWASSGFFTMRFLNVSCVLEERTVQLLEIGQKIQRFWLCASHLGLAIQPALAVLVFAHYGNEQINFTKNASLRCKSVSLARAFRKVFTVNAAELVFLGRIGEPIRQNSSCRSVRRRLIDLVFTPSVNNRAC